MANRIKAALVRRLYLRNPINVYLGQKIFGNDSGLLANAVGSLALKLDRSRCELKEKDFEEHDLQSELEHFKKKGWVRIEGLEFGNTLSEIRSQFDQYCKNKEVPESRRIEVSTIGGSETFFREFPAVKKILTTELKNFVTQYYESHFRIMNVHIYRTFPVPEELKSNKNYRAYGATICWHNDGSTTEAIKLFVLIDHVEDTNGPMHLIDAEQTQKIISGRKYFRYMTDGLPGSSLEQEADVVKFTGKPGTVLFANPNTCLHRASTPSVDKCRDMLVFYLTSNRLSLAPDWEKDAVHEQSLGFSRLFAGV